MLVLSRKVGESIVVGSKITVRVARVSRRGVSLAIEAPTDVCVDREEIHRAKNREGWLAQYRESNGTNSGPGETGQVVAECGIARSRKSNDASLVRKVPPTLNRGLVKEQCEERSASHEDHGRVLASGVLPAPPDALGLRTAVSRLIAESRASDGPEIEICDDLAVGELRPMLQVAVLCIVQELLLNACRHSKSHRVLLGLTQDDEQLCVQVQDWGVGFDVERIPRHKRGLRGIRDLARYLGGTLEIDSQRGKGACMVVEVPLTPAAECSHRPN